MILSLPKKTTMLLWLFINMVFISTAFAQTGSGNIIKDISLQTQNNQSYLVIQGLLNNLDALSRVGYKKSGKKFVISLPNSIIEPESIPDSFMAFREGDPLENIQIIETPQETDTGVSYTVDLVIQGRVLMTPLKVNPVTSSVLRFLLKKEEPKIETPKVVEKKIEIPKVTVAKTEESVPTPMTVSKPAVASAKKMEFNKKNQLSVNMSAQLEVKEIIRQYRKPSLLQVSILNASGYSRRAYKLSVYLGKIKKKHLEESLGLKLDIVNIADAKSDKYPQSTIYFRDNFLKSALFLAELIPGEQKVVPLRNQKEKIGVDIEIFLGKDYK